MIKLLYGTFSNKNWKYSAAQNKRDGSEVLLTILLFWPPSHGRNATNEVSFKSPNTELSEFTKKLGMASSWQAMAKPNLLKKHHFH